MTEARKPGHPPPEIRGMLEFPCDVERLPNGNTLITDAGDQAALGSEVIEVDPLGQIVWRYDAGLIFAHSAKRLPNGNTLIADTNNNRIIEVTPAGGIAFSSDQWSGGSGNLSDGSHLHYPNDAHQLDDGSFIITDRNNNRCVIADRTGKALWSFGEGIHHPHNCDALPNGNVLIADSDGKRIIEVNRAKEIVWQYGDGKPETLNWPRDADRLENGNTLIGDSKNSRILEVNRGGKIVWSYRAPYFANFYDVDKLPNGNILISAQQHQQVIEVDPTGNIVWAFRNFRTLRAIHPRLTNGSFKERGEDGLPAGWTMFQRLAEGGGKVIWDENASPRPAPGLEYDRPGALYLQQTVGVTPGTRYQFTGKMKTQLAAGAVAYFQVAFMDAYGGYTGDTADLPKGRFFTGDNDYTQDTFQAVAPDIATAAEVRIFITGTGRIWASGLMMFA